MITLTKDDIGKRIKFRAVCRWGDSPQIRVLTHVFEPGDFGYPGYGVTYNGCRPFYLRPDEVLEVIG